MIGRNGFGWIAVCAFCLAACAGPADGNEAPPVEEAAAEAPAADRPARALPFPGADAPTQPPAGGPVRLTWDVPEGWEEVRPDSPMRLAQFRVPGPEGDASLTVFYFGPGQGGDPMANAVRWAEQFDQPDGTSSVERMQVTDLEGSLPVRLVEVTGTFDGGMTMTAAPPVEQPGWMLLGAIAQGPDAPWFFKLTGPEATVRANRERMVGMMRSLRPAS
jgi:hypothetical protein